MINKKNNLLIMKAILVKESLNEGKKSLINYKKLEEFAKGIEACCAGEYGDTFFNEEENHIFVCLGDSHPFDEKELESFIREAVTDNYDDYKLINVTIENECTPGKENGWKKVN